MAKFKAVRKKSKAPARAPGGIPCVIFLASGMALLFFILYLVMKHANG